MFQQFLKRSHIFFLNMSNKRFSHYWILTQSITMHGAEVVPAQLEHCILMYKHENNIGFRKSDFHYVIKFYGHIDRPNM